MPREIAVVRSPGTNPYRNLAVERVLLEGVCPGACVLYLWQNARTVVIGRNQSVSDEVRLDELAACGGRLARRLTGGGAVFHDLGNLNFTFLAQRDAYDEDVQADIILAAVRSLGVDAERTGRNDLVADGRKFSGHAFRRGAGGCCHHGTLMVDVDTSQMTRFLTPPAGKLAARGVASVRSRVVNLLELSDAVTVESLADALVSAFEDAYGMRAAEFQVGGPAAVDSSAGDSSAGDFDWSRVGAYERDFASESWLFFRRHLDGTPGTCGGIFGTDVRGGALPSEGGPRAGEGSLAEGAQVGEEELACGEPVGGMPVGEGSLAVGGPHTSSARFSWGGVTLRWRETAAPGTAEPTAAPGAPGDAASHATSAPGAPRIMGLELDSDGLEADFLASVPVWLEGCPATAEAVGRVLDSHAETPSQRDVAVAIASLL